MDGASALLILSIVGFCVYFFPSYVAMDRGHPSKGGIIVINLFLGWTFLGWVIALAWAFSGKRQ